MNISKYITEIYQDFDVANVPEKCPSIEKCEWLLKLFRTKVESAMRHNKGKSEKKKEKVGKCTGMTGHIEGKISTGK